MGEIYHEKSGRAGLLIAEKAISLAAAAENVIPVKTGTN
jgi:hypothetical protein